MKLDSELVERTLSQIRAQAIPDNHPVLSKLKDLFGDHTFFLDVDGLIIIEQIEEKAQAGQVVKLANWDGADPPNLVAHFPEPTDVVIELGSMH